MLEAVILGLTQGVAEWLPISSEGTIIMVKSTFFPDGESLDELIRLALFLHLGTLFAALVYFRKDVTGLLARAFRPQENDETRKVLVFLVIATVISGALGFALLQIAGGFEERLHAGSRYVNIVIAAMLFVTAFLQLKTARDGLKTENELALKDGALLGLVQGLAVIPGLSRSGLTVSTLLLRRFNDTTALKLSFLMSLPIVLAGNIILNAGMFAEGLSATQLAALATSFVAGIITIDAFLRLARKVNFGYFALGFGILVLAAAFF